MDVAIKSQMTQERRQAERDKSTLWNKLSISQKFSATSLTQFGYELSFIRNNNSDPLAVLICNNSVATVNVDGDIDSSPDIIVR